MLAGLSWARWAGLVGRQFWPRVALGPIGKYTDHDGNDDGNLDPVQGIGELLNTGDSLFID